MKNMIFRSKIKFYYFYLDALSVETFECRDSVPDPNLVMKNQINFEVYIHKSDNLQKIFSEYLKFKLN